MSKSKELSAVGAATIALLASTGCEREPVPEHLQHTVAIHDARLYTVEGDEHALGGRIVLSVDQTGTSEHALQTAAEYWKQPLNVPEHFTAADIRCEVAPEDQIGRLNPWPAPRGNWQYIIHCALIESEHIQ